jgi:hypothetical protein
MKDMQYAQDQDQTHFKLQVELYFAPMQVEAGRTAAADSDRGSRLGCQKPPLAFIYLLFFIYLFFCVCLNFI